MAFGFPASYKKECDLIASRQIARDAIVYAFGALEWRFETAGADLYYAEPRSTMTAGEEVSVSLKQANKIIVKSICTWPLQLYDWGNNKRNVEQFLARFTPKELRELKLPAHEPIFFDSDGKTPLENALSEGDPG